MCGDLWDKQDADVACRVMGFNGSVSAGFKTEKSRKTKVDFWISNVLCFGNESSLFSCAHQRSYGCANDKIAWTLCNERKGEFNSPNATYDTVIMCNLFFKLVPVLPT